MTDSWPKFSVVVPTHGRPAALRRCLAALARLDYPRERFEVVVVDDGGPESLDEVFERARGELDVRLVRQENRGPATARNHGVAHSRGELIAFTDDDCRPRPDWLNAFAVELGRTPHAVLGGRTENALPDNVYSETSQRLIAYLYDYYNRDPDRGRFFASNNMAMARETFDAARGFDVTYPRAAAEDRELCDHLLQLGRQLRYVSSAVVRHAHDLTLRSFFRQHLHYGRGAYLFHRVKHRRGGGDVAVEPWRFYRDLVLCPFRDNGSVSRPWAVASLLALSQVAGVCGYITERVGQDRNGAPRGERAV